MCLGVTQANKSIEVRRRLLKRNCVELNRPVQPRHQRIGATRGHAAIREQVDEAFLSRCWSMPSSDPAIAQAPRQCSFEQTNPHRWNEFPGAALSDYACRDSAQPRRPIGVDRHQLGRHLEWFRVARVTSVSVIDNCSQHHEFTRSRNHVNVSCFYSRGNFWNLLKFTRPGNAPESWVWRTTRGRFCCAWTAERRNVRALSR